MSAPMIALLVLGVLAVAGAAAGVVAVLRRSASLAVPLAANPMRPRVTAEVHAGEEQVLLHLARTLELPTGRDQVGYGQIYIAGSAGSTLQLQSRSEIGRGFDGEVRVHRTRSASVVEYYVLRVPGDDTLHQRIGDLDARIADSLRALDPQARLRLGRSTPVGRGAPATAR